MEPQVMLLVGAGGAFVGLATIVGVLAMPRRISPVERSLDAIASMTVTAPDALDGTFRERVLSPATLRLAGVARRMSPAGRGDVLRKRLDAAGSPAGWDVDRVLAYKVVGLVVGGALSAVVFFSVLGLAALPAGVLTIGVAVLGYFIPDLVLYQTAYNRKERIQKELPDALDMLTISVEAGLAFDAALAQVARNSTGPLGEEFFRVLQEMQIGLGRTEAMRGMGERCDVPDLKSFVTAMVQAETFGIPIAHVLRVQAREMRLKRTQRAEEQAQKLAVKLLFPLIFCIMPALFVVVIGPAAINIAQNFIVR